MLLNLYSYNNADKKTASYSLHEAGTYFTPWDFGGGFNHLTL
jgi:hypothetical protein